LENEKIELEQIVIATGEQRKLDNIAGIKIRQRCSFAYIFYFFVNTKTAKDAEQLFGKFLRMSY